MKKLILSSLLIALSCVSSFAAVIITNPITGTNPNTANPYTTGQTFDPGVTVTGIGRGAGITGTNANDRYNATGFETTQAAAITGSDYFTFTIDATAGNTVNYTDFVYTSQASGTGPTGVFFRTSVDNFAANVGSATVGGTTISLSGASFQGLADPVEFRLYAFGGSGGTYSVNNFTFNGTVVPEPSTYAMIAGGLGLMLVVSRRKARLSA